MAATAVEWYELVVFPSSSVTRGLSSMCVRRGDASSHMLIVTFVPVKLNPVGPPGQTLVVETVTASAKPKGMRYCGPFSSRLTRYPRGPSSPPITAGQPFVAPQATASSNAACCC